ncbi:MAG TPA: C39 family peptidase [Kofleriaceae bacterium]|nr:C39 family peptidase [Kofleriaceae bacterium]
MRRHRLSVALLVLAACAGSRPRELAVPDVRQATDYTCSASALQAVLAYYGVEKREDELARELGATPEDGAPPEAIVRVAMAHGLRAQKRENMTVEDLAAEVAGGRPVIVEIQAWSDTPRMSWADAWDDGHYVIVVAIDGDRLVFEDPSVLGSRAVLSRRELEERWHDIDGGYRNIRTGIVFGGKPPVPAPARVHMD